MMTNLENRWNRFWFEERSTESLCLLRIFFGAVFLMKMTGFHNLQRIGKLRARFPNHTFREESDYFLGAFRLPVPGFEWLPVPELWQYQALETVLLIAGLFFVVGLCRPSGFRCGRNQLCLGGDVHCQRALAHGGPSRNHHEVRRLEPGEFLVEVDEAGGETCHLGAVLLEHLDVFEDV